MGVELITERHAGQIAGVLGCWDRMLIFGVLPKICFAGGMTTFLYERKIRIFDYRKFAEPFRNRIRENAGKMAVEAGIEIEFIGKAELPQGRPGERDSGPAGRAAGAGLHLPGDGTLPGLQALAQQADRQDVSGSG